MSSTFKTLFYLRKNYLNRAGKAPIMIRLTINGDMVQFNSKMDIEPALWNPRLQGATGKSEKAKAINTILEGMKCSIQNHYYQIVREDEIPTPEKVRDSFLGIIDKQNSLLTLFKRHLDNLNNIIGKGLAKATYDKYDLTYRRLEEFMKFKYKISDIPLRDIKNIFVVDFENWLMSTHNYGKNTRAKFLQRFHSIILIAKRNNWIKADPFADFTIGSQKVDRGYLTQDEVNNIWERKMYIPRLEKVRDAFIFACYTGLAYIDVCGLKKYNIVTIDGQKWIRTNRQKTTTLVEVPLLEIPELIIEKYKNLSSDDSLIPMSSNQKMNAYLKEIADLCSIEKNITFHLARHTFATTITLSKGVSMESVSKMLGHTKITTTQIYARILNTKVKEEMQLVTASLENGSVLVPKTTNDVYAGGSMGVNSNILNNKQADFKEIKQEEIETISKGGLPLLIFKSDLLRLSTDGEKLFLESYYFGYMLGGKVTIDNQNGFFNKPRYGYIDIKDLQELEIPELAA